MLLHTETENEIQLHKGFNVELLMISMLEEVTENHIKQIPYMSMKIEHSMDIIKSINVDEYAN